MYIKNFCFNIHHKYIAQFEKILKILIYQTKKLENPIKFEYKKEDNSFFIEEIWDNETSFLSHQKTSHFLDFKKNRQLYVKSKITIN